MGQRCTACSHPESFEINEALVVKQQSKRTVADQYGLKPSAVQRHRDHIPELLLKAKDRLDTYSAEAILTRIEDLEKETLEQLEGSKGDVEDGEGNRSVVLQAIREQRSNIELVAKIKQLIDQAPQVNIEMHPEFIAIQNNLALALAQYPEARRAVIEALGGERVEAWEDPTLEGEVEQW